MAHDGFFPSATAPSSIAELLARCLEALAMSGLDVDKRWLGDVVALPMEEFLVVMEAMFVWFMLDHEEDRQWHEGEEED
jgi:type II secretory pathway component PulL